MQPEETTRKQSKAKQIIHQTEWKEAISPKSKKSTLLCVTSNRGTWGKGNGDKRHGCFHLELDYGLNSGLNKDNTSMKLFKVVS